MTSAPSAVARWLGRALLLALVGCAVSDAHTLRQQPQAAEETREIFNGRDLTGWDGNPELWSVVDGAITGRTSADKPLKTNTFLVWKGGLVRDFELRLKFRFISDSLKSGNSGVQYRSRLVDPTNWVIAGYQADMDAAGRYIGMLYEERGRGILASPGQQVRVMSAGDEPIPNQTRIEVTGTTAPAARIAPLVASVGKGEWLDMHIIARGTHLQHFVNDVKTAEADDLDRSNGAGTGLLALQLHAGAPYTIQFKDIRLTTPVAPPRPAAQTAPEPPATPPESILVAPGFKVELIYSVPKADQGSWVAMTVDDKGRLITSDQYGGLYRVTPPPVGTATGATVEALQSPLTGAQGILYAFNSLYVMVNESPEVAHGLWRLRDLDGDGKYEDVKLLRELRGGGEHGPHAIVPGPDGRSIYFIAGNETRLPRIEYSRPLAWSEDHLMPRLWDRSERIPDGWVARTDPDGERVELVAMGFRNEYDVAFDANGELFTYDSDMEWDQGLPWYVPTRIVHVVDGGDYGFRGGTGRWPPYYADALPAIHDIGSGSPTGVTFGTGAKFPAAFQRALFSADWTYGTLYAVHLTPVGASFRAQRTEFVAGKPLPLTDVVINPRDGALYFTTGGRRIQSALYRVTYVGSESVAPVAPLPSTPQATLRRELEALHAEGVSPEAVDKAWPHLGDADRFIRFAARVAIEKQPPAVWMDRALSEQNPRSAIEALIALARVGGKEFITPVVSAADLRRWRERAKMDSVAAKVESARAAALLRARIVKSLERFPLSTVPADLKLPLLRAWALTFTRLGKPDQPERGRIAAKLEQAFPSPDPFVSRELATLLIFLDSPTIVSKTVPLLRVPSKVSVDTEVLGANALLARNDSYGRVVQAALQNPPDLQQIAYAYALRNARVGWTPRLRRQYFEWFPTTLPWKGGNQFVRGVQSIRSEALLKLVPDAAERASLEQLSAMPAQSVASTAVTIQGPGRTYTVAGAMAVVNGQLQDRDFARGRAMFTASGCLVCHRFNGEGGGQGPDLSTAGRRFNLHDLIENIIVPSLVVSDQYENIMPPGLINRLNQDELRDLMAYILSGGNPMDKMFRQQR